MNHQDICNDEEVKTHVTDMLTTASRYPRQYVSLMIEITVRADRRK
jgi:hypothetical protein